LRNDQTKGIIKLLSGQEGETEMGDENEAAKVKAQTTYNAASDHFDDVPLGFWERYGRRTVERLRLASGSTVLDVGCGTGASALPAAEKVAPDGRVIGVDLAEKLLALGRAKATHQGLQNIEFRVGDMENLGFPDDHFDAVVSVFSIFFVPNMERQIRELWRMVRPGGQIAITTWGPNFAEPLYGKWLEAVKRVRPDLSSGFRPWDRITTPEALRQLLRDGGLPEAEIIPENGSQTLRSPEDWWTIVLGSGLRWTVDQLEAELARQVREDNLQWARENGIESVQMNVIYAVATKGQVS
jgi:ubiquinone/menaquinone biosynthesis C-methylase UbiE